jgi:signal transduction histidine kinase
MQKECCLSMKLAAKLILIFLIGVLGIVGVSAWLAIDQQLEWDQERRDSHAAQLVDAISPAIAKAYKEGGTITVAQAVEVSSQTISGTKLRFVDGTHVSLPKTTTTAREVSKISVSNADGTQTTHSFVPLTIDGKDAGTVQVSHLLDQHDPYLRKSITRSLASLVAVTLLSGVVIYFGGIRMVGRPLDKLTTQVNSIGEGNLHQPPVLFGNDEFGRLSRAISAMSDRLRQQRDAIRHTDRLGTVGTLAAGIAHELGTPLNVVSGQAGLIAGGRLTLEEVNESAVAIKEEADRMTAIIRQLLDFARQKPSPHRVVDIAELVRRTCDLMESLARKQSVDIHVDVKGEGPCAIGDASQLQQVFTNLLSNAIDAMPDGGDIRVIVSMDSDSGSVCIDVTDTGTGIENENIQRLFEPFFTTKDVGDGTGLGLSIAYGIITEHGGQITVCSQPNAGSTFRVTLPSVGTAERTVEEANNE